MRAALALLFFSACAAPAPQPAPRLADTVQVQVVQLGWLQVASGIPSDPPVVDLRHGRAPDLREAEENAQAVLAKCRSGAAMEPLQREFSEEPPGTLTVETTGREPFRDLALSLKPGECALYRSNYAFHVLKRVQ